MQNLIINAIQHHQAGQLDEAATLYQQVLANEPNHPDALHLLGVLAFQRGVYGQAAAMIERAIALNADSAVYYCNLAEVHRAMGQFQKAVQFGQKAIELQPDYAEAQNNLGLAWLDWKKFDEAERAFRDAIAARPEFPMCYNNLGQALREQNRREEAIEAYRESVRINPQLAEGHNNLGQLLLEEHHEDDALTHCREAVRLKPDMPHAQSNLGNVLRQQGDLEGAKRCYAEAIRLSPSLGMPYNNMGQVFQQEGHFDEAMRWYAQALERESNSARFHSNLASALSEQERFDEAKQRFQIAVDLEPDYAEAYNGLGSVCREQGEFSNAVEYFQKAIDCKPELAESHVHLGQAYEEQGDHPRAEACFREAMRLDPRPVGAYVNLATHHRAKLADEDLATLEALLDDPQMTEAQLSSIHFGLAQVYDGKKEYDRAAAEMLAANRLQLAWRVRRGQGYSPSEHTTFVDGVIEAFNQNHFQRVGLTSSDDDVEAIDAWGNPSGVPVFVVGLPRSGTTLTEQILASHPQIHGAGELRLAREGYDSAAARLAGDGTPNQVCDKLCRNDVQLAAHNHLAALVGHSNEATRIVDKMPDNYLYLGWIVTLFPNARIIHCNRDVRDTSISCWITNFKSIRWASSEEHIARRVRDYQRIMEYWRDALPRPMLDVHYEETVDDLESVARRMIDWVGVEWNDACIAFHKTKRPIRTASVTQARQPIHTKSRGRWKNYESSLASLIGRLPVPEKCHSSDDTS